MGPSWRAHCATALEPRQCAACALSSTTTAQRPVTPPDRRACAQRRAPSFPLPPPQEILELVVTNWSTCDSINLTAAIQRIAKLADSSPHGAALREAVLASSVFCTMAGAAGARRAG